MVLIEFSGDDEELDKLKLEKFIQKIYDDNLVIDASLSLDITQEQVSYYLNSLNTYFITLCVHWINI